MATPFHPLVVHVPIVLLPIAAILATRERFRRGAGPGDSVDLLLVLGTIGAIAAAASGQHEESSLLLSGAQLDRVRAHATIAQWVPWLSGSALLLRIRLRLRVKSAERAAWLPWLQIAMLAALLGAGFLALLSGHRGALLVHRDGITRATIPARTLEPSPASEHYEAETPPAR